MNPSVPRLEVHSRWIGTCARNALVITAPALLISFPGTEVVEPGMAIVVMILMQVLLVQVVQVLLVYMHRCLHRLHRCLDPGPVAMHLVVLPPVALSWLQMRFMLPHAAFALLATAPSLLSVRPCRIEVGQGSIAVKGYRTAKVLVGTTPALFLRRPSLIQICPAGVTIERKGWYG